MGEELEQEKTIEQEEKREDSEATVEEGQEKSKLAQELEEAKRALEEERRRSESHLNRLKYLQADFENHRKQTSREFREQAQFGKREMLRKMIDHREDLTRAIENSDADVGEVMKGIKMILANLDAMLTEDGVEPIETAGKKFDPNLHEAASFSSESEKEEGTIVSELRKGYTIHGKVLRPSVVEVASKREKEGEEVEEKIG